jgi:N-dimethylarginine dimethylaminohydrolase
MTAIASISRRIVEFGEMYAANHPPLATRFEAEVESYWGRAWGVASEVGKLRAVLVHCPGREMNAVTEPLAKWRFTEKPDASRMRAAHARLIRAFLDADVEVVVRECENGPAPRLVKSVYTRDPSFAVPGGVIVGRMYDALRRGEEAWTARTFANIGCPVLRTLNGSAVMEGGSVVWVGPKHLAIGITARGNLEGARQIKDVVNSADPDIDVQCVEVRHPSGHLDVPLTMVNVGTAVLDLRCVPEWFVSWLKNAAKVEVVAKPDCTYVEGTVVLEPGKVLFDDGVEEERKRGRKLLQGLGLEVIPVDLDTLTFPQNSGTLHCLTMPLIRDPEA